MRKITKIFGDVQCLEKDEKVVFTYTDKNSYGEKTFTDHRVFSNKDNIEWVQVKVRNVSNNDDGKIQFSIETRKKGRSYHTSFSIPKEFESAFIKAVSEEWNKE